MSDLNEKVKASIEGMKAFQPPGGLSAGVLRRQGQRSPQGLGGYGRGEIPGALHRYRN